MYVTLDSDGAYELKTVPDVMGLHAQRPGAAVIRALLGRDSPDVKVLDRGFHDATLLDMGDSTGLVPSAFAVASTCNFQHDPSAA